MYSLSTKIITYLEKRGHLFDENKEVIAYGLFFLIFNLYCFALTIILGAAFKRVIESIVFFFSFLFIKKYAGGYHASKEWACVIISSLGVIISILIIYFSQIDILIYRFSFAFSVMQSIMICALSPLEAQNRPLDKADAKKYRKYSLIRTTIVFFTSFVLYYSKCYVFATPIIAALIFEGTLIVLGYIQKRIRLRRTNAVL